MDASKAALQILWLSASIFSYHMATTYFPSESLYLPLGIAFFCLLIYLTIGIAYFKCKKRLGNDDPAEFFLANHYVIKTYLITLAIYNIGFYEWTYITNIYIKYIVFILCSSISCGAIFGSLVSAIMLRTCRKHKVYDLSE